MIKLFLIFNCLLFFTVSLAREKGLQDSIFQKNIAPREDIVQEDRFIKKSGDLAAEQPEDIPLLIKYFGVIDTTIFAVYYDQNIFLPIKTFLQIFKIPYDESDNSIIFSYPGNNEKRVDFAQKNIVVNDTIVQLEQEGYFEYPDDIYLKKEILEKFISVNIYFNFNKLSIKIESEEYLPVYKEYLRIQNYRFLKRDKKSSMHLLYPLNRKWLAGSMLDYHLSTSYGKEISPNYNYQFNYGGEVIGGELKVDLIGNYINKQHKLDNIDYLWNYVIAEDYISRITIGNQYTEGLNTYSTEAITITNEPITPRKIYNQIILTDEAPQFSTVELYINEKLFDYIKVGESGNYNFILPLTYGTTSLKIISYDTDGRIMERRNLFQIPTAFNPVGELNYNFSLGRHADTKKLFMLGTASMGISDWLSNTTGIEYLENDLNKNAILFNTLKARFFSNFILDITAAPNAYYSSNLSAFTSDLHSFNIFFRRYENNLFYNPSLIKNEINTNIYSPFYINNPVNFNLSGRYIEYSDLYNLEYKIETGSHFGNFHPSIEFRGSKVKNSIERFFLTGGFLLSIPLINNLIKESNGNLFSFKTNYNFSSKKIEGLNLSFATTLYNYNRLQISYYKNFAGGFSNFQLQLIAELPFTRSTTFASENLLSQNFQGSLNYDMPNDRFYFYNRTSTGKAAAAVYMYIDKNGNNQHDYGEEEIKNGRIIMEGAYVKKSNDEYSYFYELNPYTEYVVKVDEKSIKNPLLKPSIKEFSFVAEPNQVKSISIPFYISGEISGEVYEFYENEKREAWGIQILVENIDGEIVKIRTFGDGSFYYFGIRPGKYKIYIDPKYVKNKISFPQEYSIEIETEENKNFISDIIFEIRENK